MKVKDFKTFANLRKQLEGKKIRVLRMTLAQFRLYYWLLSGEEWNKKSYYNFTFMGIPIKYVD